MSQMVPRLGGELSSLPSTAFRSPIRDVPDITPPSDHQLNQPIHRVFVDRMANEVRQVIWNGSIPLRIVLESSESRSKEEVEYYVTGCRLSYLPSYLPEILQYFKPYLNQPSLAGEMSWWFEFENAPVKWNWPIGLSYDLLTGLDPIRTDEDAFSIPWKLTLRHRSYPSDYLLALENENTVQSYWLNQCKQSCYVRDGKSAAIMNLSKHDTEELWSSVYKRDFDIFWSITTKILPSRASLRNVPLRVYLPGSNKTIEAPLPSLKSDSSPHTLGSALHSYLPEIFPSKRTCILARPVLHGVVVPMAADLVDLLYQAMYTDGFLHVSVVMMH